MSIISKIRKQTCVHFAKTGFDVFGKVTYSSAVEISCRWENGAERYMDQQGETAISTALIYTEDVMQIEDVLVLSSLAAITDTSNPLNNTGAVVVKQISSTPNIRATETLHMAYGA